MKLTTKQIKKIQKIAVNWLNLLYSHELTYKKDSYFSYWINGDIKAEVLYNWTKKTWGIKVQNLSGESAFLDI